MYMLNQISDVTLGRTGAGDGWRRHRRARSGTKPWAGPTNQQLAGPFASASWPSEKDRCSDEKVPDSKSASKNDTKISPMTNIM